jgi:predicted secreted protein
MPKNGADEIKINELEKSLKELETLYNLANNKADALWRKSLMSLVERESIPKKQKLHGEPQLFKAGMYVIASMFGIGEQLRANVQEIESQPMKLWQYDIEECKKIVDKLTYDEMVDVYRDFKEHGLDKTIRKWIQISKSRKKYYKVLEIVRDPDA